MLCVVREERKTYYYFYAKYPVNTEKHGARFLLFSPWSFEILIPPDSCLFILSLFSNDAILMKDKPVRVSAMTAVELTPKHSTPWWSLFDCCHTPSASSLPNNEDHDGHCNESNNSFRFPLTPSINVVMRGKIVAGEEAAARPETPSTACTGSSAGKETSVGHQTFSFVCSFLFSAFTNIYPYPELCFNLQYIIVICDD